MPTDITDPYAILRNCRPISEPDLVTFPEGACSVLGYREKILEEVHRGYRFGTPVIDFDYGRYFGASDALLDVENMLVTAERNEWPDDQDLGKLQMYGVLQALAVQNQATLQVLKCFGRKGFFFMEDVFNDIKELRIAVAGHPSDHNKKGLRLKGCTFLGQRVFGSRTRFTVVTYVDFEKSVQREVDVLALIARQSSAVNANLGRVWNAICNNGGIAATLFSETKQ